MFSLIITIIAIALVAALAVASIYYGGSAFEKGTAGAEAATIINESQQVSAARSMASADGNANATVADLVTGNYLSSAPSGLTLDAGHVVGSVATQAVCTEINDRSGNTGLTYDTAFGLLTLEQTITARFGCAEDTDVVDKFDFMFK